MPAVDPDDNGILARVPGEYVAAGSKLLPPAATAVDETMTAELDAAHAGRVRITYRRVLFGRHKAKYWAWHALRADPA